MFLRQHMRREDRTLLEEPYEDGAEVLDQRLPKRLGVLVESAHLLGAEIHADLDTTRYGIGWWAPHLGTKRRILISDYLYQSTHSIQTNLVEAAVHLLEARHAWEQQDAMVADAVTRDLDGEPKFNAPTITGPTDELPNVVSQLHLAGFFRAAASTADCVGAAIVGVAGLPTSILRADWNSALRALRGIDPVDAGTTEQVQLLAALDALVDSLGPAGWLHWMLGYRNMLVHRARRMTVNGVEPIPPTLVDVQQRPIVRCRSRLQLHVDPSRSEMEVLLHHDHRQYVEENARDTLSACLESVTQLAETTCALLLEVWHKRRTNPALVAQPVAQWPKLEEPNDVFRGYKPSGPPSHDQMVTSPTFRKRVLAAALDEASRPKWDDPDFD